MSRSLGLRSIPDQELLRRLSRIVDRHRRCECEVVAHIAEVDARKLYLGCACSSMFRYCVEVLHLSEHEAYMRIACARASRRFPQLLDRLGDGRMHLSGIAKLAPHLRKETADALLDRATHMTKRQIEELVAEVAPRPEQPSRIRKLPSARVRPSGLGPNQGVAATPGATDSNSGGPSIPVTQPVLEPVPTAAPGLDSVSSAPDATEPPTANRSVLEPIAPARYKVTFTANAELHDKLCRARALLRHKVPDGDLAAVLDEAVSLLLAKLEGRRFGKTDAPRRTLADTDTSASSRHIPAAVRRFVYERDGGRCTFVDASGRRCSCADSGRLEYHHMDPYAKGGNHDPHRITLRCEAHNQYGADLDFGVEKMQRHRTGQPSPAREAGACYYCCGHLERDAQTHVDVVS